MDRRADQRRIATGGQAKFSPVAYLAPILLASRLVRLLTLVI
jgi:hypothetical protein